MSDNEGLTTSDPTGSTSSTSQMEDLETIVQKSYNQLLVDILNAAKRTISVAYDQSITYLHQERDSVVHELMIQFDQGIKDSFIGVTIDDDDAFQVGPGGVRRGDIASQETAKSIQKALWNKLFTHSSRLSMDVVAELLRAAGNMTDERYLRCVKNWIRHSSIGEYGQSVSDDPKPLKRWLGEFGQFVLDIEYATDQRIQDSLYTDDYKNLCEEGTCSKRTGIIDQLADLNSKVFAM